MKHFQFNIKASLNTIRSNFRSASQYKLARDLSWMGSSQLLSRIFRLASTVIIARILDTDILGLAAISLTFFDFIQILTRRSTSLKIIQSEDSKISAICASAYSLNWSICIGGFLLSGLLSIPISYAYKQPSLVFPICALGGGLLLMPYGMVHAALNIRQGRLDVVARSEFLQTCVGALMTPILAILGFGVWSIVIPVIIGIPIWSIIHRHYQSWRPPASLFRDNWPELIEFGKDIVGSDAFTFLQQNIDYILIGILLGVDALGIYYFAYNAGLGLSLGLLNAFSTSIYPHFCEARGDRLELNRRFYAGIKTILAIAVPLIFMQTTFASYYVPIVYGSQWVSVGALPVLVILCITGLVKPLAEASSQLLLSVGKTKAVLLVISLIALRKV